MGFINTLTASFKANVSVENAVYMKKYMKDKFVFMGLKTDLRRSLFKLAATEYKDEVKEHPRELAKQLYGMPQREYHYCAVEILMKELKNKFSKDDINLTEYLLITHSWWDTVDVIAKYLLGGYLQQYPEETLSVINRFSSSDNMWLNRSAILFQLGYKKDTDASILFSECLKHKESNEFFIQKAIGWALREYGKTDPDAVRNFVFRASLKPLSTREALKNL
ncbi:DNA alkylation repair protein [Flavobacterium salilacus subsp. salilacus]|uniref:DNA alkylation repair protein n=1 Tax=Flavobacterium TaxID=237 RepID=UPI001074C6BD|nr:MULTISPECIES: DNA alkylation repair protein [Flavobacterium]KAF2517539.1 DNA alkylation repair protein [Flavobacterium salilacus subsp. salilacus]MBE1615687.1 DNA alkylation repair protein [Flavobacterium sp. SaA2.13]